MSSQPDELVSAAFDPVFDGTLQERAYVKQSLQGFHDDQWLTDVLFKVRGGKEANVYCCRGHPSTGMPLLAAKIYRPRIFRAMHNDALYKQGRAFLDSEGKQIRDRRALRAIRRHSRFGRNVETGSWNRHEFDAMNTFQAAGADIPAPLAHGHNCILMEFVGDQSGAAPTLQSVRPSPGECVHLFHRLVRNIELFLAVHRIHADLSPYNVLYWRGRISIIDFPQVVDARTHPQAFDLLLRDVTRICDYFARLGVAQDAPALAHRLWRQYL